MSTTELSIIIPTHMNRAGALRLLLSIEAQKISRHRFEVCVVANPHDSILQGAITILKARGLPVRYLTSSLGVNRAKNAGVQNTTGRFIYFVDDDCVLHCPDHLEKVLQTFSNQSISAVGSEYSVNARDLSFLDRAYNLQTNLWLRQYVNDSGSTKQLLGGNAAYRREVFNYFCFDETVLYGADEVMLNASLFQSGYSLKFDPELNVTHKPQLTLQKFLLKAKCHGENRRSLVPPEKSVYKLAAVQYIERPIRQLPLYFYILLFQIVFRYSSAIKHIIPNADHDDVGSNMANPNGINIAKSHVHESPQHST